MELRYREVAWHGHSLAFEPLHCKYWHSRHREDKHVTEAERQKPERHRGSANQHLPSNLPSDSQATACSALRLTEHVASSWYRDGLLWVQSSEFKKKKFLNDSPAMHEVMKDSCTYVAASGKSMQVLYSRLQNLCRKLPARCPKPPETPLQKVFMDFNN